MNIEIVPNLNSGEEEGSNLNESPHHHEGTTAVIENIDTITNNNNNNDEDGGLLSAAVSDDTSATSIASNLSDGNPRPRSASLHITPSNHHNTNGDRPSSIPRLRPRSNPRTRTPMRHESPLLVISPIVAAGSAIIAENDGTGGIANHHRNGSEATAQLEDGDTNNNNEQLIRNIFHTRSSRARRLRAGSIPEEIVEDDGSTIVVDDNTSLVAANNDNLAAGNQVNNETNTTASAAAAVANNNTTTRTAGRFFTQAVAPTSTRRRRNNRTTEPNNTTQQQRTLSTKQNPSHRKIRRWKNDAFIGTPSEHVHTMLMTNRGEEEGWNEFPYMPNHPLEYNSEFSKLSVDRSRGGEKVRERFVKGEVASGDFAVKKKNGSGEEEEVGEEVLMQRRIVAKCRQLGIPSKVIMDEESEWGKVLYDKLGMRIQSILSRSCSSADTNASRIVATFESYLVSLALHSKLMTGNDDDDIELGFPPLQPQVVYDVFEDILASPPRIVMRNKQLSSSNNNCNNQRIGKASAAAAAKEVSGMNKCGVLIPTVHFYFPTEGQDGSSRRSSAFHRILLYAVCQFHGLETSSSVVPEKKLKRDNGRRKGQQKQNREVKGSMKVVTVQAGVLLAPSTKLLDFVCT
ncbi:hypothetical protein QTG54_008307 [Skeletonema marinoi]|uniref:Uncharacterized protein n=1 Tax=Skeletonema marinoi TaxID=267567 RepID=A0AAD8Y8N1_9STRA|nr:hypothetical protein QTG54_008307 [Skeletonema marinoi]